MLDIKQTYDNFTKQIKTNKNFLIGLDTLLSSEGIVQLSIFQFIQRNNKNGTTLDLLMKVGIDGELAKIILDEAVKTKIMELRGDKYYITDTGNNILIATHLRALESLL